MLFKNIKRDIVVHENSTLYRIGGFFSRVANITIFFQSGGISST